MESPAAAATTSWPSGTARPRHPARRPSFRRHTDQNQAVLIDLGVLSPEFRGQHMDLTPWISESTDQRNWLSEKDSKEWRGTGDSRGSCETFPANHARTASLSVWGRGSSSCTPLTTSTPRAP